jgi:acyl dehydratase
MPLNPDAVGTASEPEEVSWTSKDSLLYALGVGAGMIDPTGFELEFTTENSADVEQQALPTMPVVVSSSHGVWSEVGEFDLAMLVHGEQAVVLHQPFPVAGKAMVQKKIVAMYDKVKAAVVVLEGEGRDLDGNLLWTTRASMFIRGAGGWGGDRGPSGSANVVPDRAPDEVVSYTTRADQALLYRLSGDRNRLHSDPTFAARAGFPKPILHGLCTYGFTGRALLHAVCGSDPARFKSIEGRFSQPVMPGDTLDVRIWVDGNEAIFQTVVGENPVIDAGRLVFE